jgi:mercuric ion transport protein
MSLMTRVADKTGVIGSIVTAAGCTACFPALVSLAAAVGLGFLSRYEGLFITILLPVFAAVALLANALAWRSQRQSLRTALGLIGPLLVIAAALLMRFAGVSTAPLLYMGLAFMVGASIWDLLSPARRHGGPDRCELPAKGA